MNVIFKFQDVTEIVNDGVPILEENVNNVQQVVHKEQRKKDGKVLFLIHQCVDPNVFENIIEEETTKGVCDKLKNVYDGDEKLKRVKLQTLRKLFEIIQMKEDESVSKFFTDVVSLTNQIKANGESITDLHKIEKVLRSMIANFGYIVVSIEEFKNLAEMKVEELQASLKAREMRLKQRNSGRKKVVDRDFRREKESIAKDDYEVKYAHVGESDTNDMLLMKNTQSNNEQTNMWYLDSGCSNHMTGNKNWFIKLDESVNKVTKFADGKHVTSEEKGNIIMVRNGGRRANITDALYVPSMTSNLISTSQLLSKGYNTKLEENIMKVYNGEGMIILKAPLVDNKTFKIEINMVDHQCLALTTVEYKKWL
ncbi:uncharacterized protein LOC127123938 [Lathyrus oleraceus]|uniref:uncharacterized protein LOC127123938 n=1 Tax=Pisum sativum TaxID=3888 RepID=UPI0021D2A3B2|nr:uncharacterized protein LOC127123938 [Pisum sativum]